MKRLLSIVTIVLCSILPSVAEQINVADFSLAQGDSATVEITLSNVYSDLVAFQMDLTLPEGIGIEKAECRLSSRITDEEQELVIGKLETGGFRLISSSMALVPFSGTDGTLLTLKLTATEDCVGGQATMSNIRFSTSNSEKVILNDVAFGIRILHKYKLTYIVDGEEIADPWSVTTGFEGKRSMVCDMNDTNPESWSSDIHVFYEHGNAITYVDVPTFSADPMSGVSESNMGKYLALTENGTTYGNEGMVPTCMFALKEDGTKAVVIDIDAPQTMPDNAYVSNPYDGNSTVNDFKQVAQAVHNTFDMSLFVRFDFSATPVHKPMTKDFVVKTSLYWVDEYHADGIVLATDLDAETKAAVREALDAIDTRIILATDDEITDMQTGIEGVKADGITKGKGIYTIDGRHLNGKPAQKGIYINGGKKIAVQ